MKTMKYNRLFLRSEIKIFLILLVISLFSLGLTVFLSASGKSSREDLKTISSMFAVVVFPFFLLLSAAISSKGVISRLLRLNVPRKTILRNYLSHSAVMILISSTVVILGCRYAMMESLPWIIDVSLLHLSLQILLILCSGYLFFSCLFLLENIIPKGISSILVTAGVIFFTLSTMRFDDISAFVKPAPLVNMILLAGQFALLLVVNILLIMKSQTSSN